jgi:hypothetical protein
MQMVLQDLRHAFRQVRKSPGFAFTIVITLALGIGANSAIFSVMNAALLRMLPVRNPAQLFYLTHAHWPDNVGSTGNSEQAYGINVYHRLREATRENGSVFSDVIAYVPLSFSKTAVRFGDSPEEAEADEVSGNFFSALGVSTAAGRPFVSADEDRHSPVAVLSYGYWNRRFHHNPDVIGQTIYVNGVPVTILGVASPSFYGVESGGRATDLWMPLQNRRSIRLRLLAWFATVNIGPPTKSKSPWPGTAISRPIPLTISILKFGLWETPRAVPQPCCRRSGTRCGKSIPTSRSTNHRCSARPSRKAT